MKSLPPAPVRDPGYAKQLPNHSNFMIPENSEIIFMRHKSSLSRREFRFVVVAVLVGMLTAALLALLMFVEAGKHSN